MSRYLVRDDSVLDLPPTRQLWLLFGLVVSVLVGLLLLILQDFQEDLANLGIVLFSTARDSDLDSWFLTPGSRLVGDFRQASGNSYSQEGCRGLAYGGNGIRLPCVLVQLPRGTRTNPFRTRPLGLRVLAPRRGRTIVRGDFQGDGSSVIPALHQRSQARLPGRFHSRPGLRADRELPVHRGIAVGWSFRRLVHNSGPRYRINSPATRCGLQSLVRR